MLAYFVLALPGFIMGTSRGRTHFVLTSPGLTMGTSRERIPRDQGRGGGENGGTLVYTAIPRHMARFASWTGLHWEQRSCQYTRRQNPFDQHMHAQTDISR